MRCSGLVRSTMQRHATQKKFFTRSNPSPTHRAVAVAACRDVARLVAACRAVSRLDALRSPKEFQVQAEPRARVKGREGRTSIQVACGRGLRFAQHEKCAASAAGP